MFVVVFVAVIYLIVAQRSQSRDPFYSAVFIMGIIYILPGLARMVASFERKDMKEPKADVPASARPAVSYENWKKDLNDVIDENLSIDDFVDRWSGCDIQKGERRAVPASSGEKDRLRGLVEQARKRILGV